jgi:L-alanine-DL-glutamate epimerase-like enolase superfamily enzyme
VLNFRRLVDKQLAFKNGDLLLHQTPGLGFKFDERAVKKYALDRSKPWTIVK